MNHITPRRLAFFALGLILGTYAFTDAHADTKITALPAASALGGTDPIPTVQGGVTVKTTPAAIDFFVISQLISGDITSKFSGTCDVTTFLRGDGACALVSLTSNVSGVLPVANGGLNLSAATDDNVTVGNGTTWQSKALPSCSGATSALAYNIATNAFSCNTITPGTGTVTSVAIAAPSIFTVSGSPVTTTGTLTLTAAGTSGGVPYFNAATTMASSAALTASQLVLGGGAGAAPASLGSLGTTTTLLHGNAAGAPTFAAASLTADVSGLLPVANGGTGVGTLANDSLFMGNGTSAMSAKAVPSCSAGTSALTYNTTTDTWGCNTIAAGGSVAGSDTQIQYNNAGAFGASASMTWTDSTSILSLGKAAQQTTIQALPTGGASVSQLNLLGGNSSGGGGYVHVQGGSATSGSSPGGNLELQGGTQLGTGAGGDVTLQGGLTVDGNGGNVTVLARNGAGTNRNGGGVTLNTGTATGSGTPGRINMAGPVVSTGTKFTASGCSNSTTVGGIQAGTFVSGTTGTCTVTITLPSAPTGWACAASDRTTTANLISQSASSVTSCTITGTTVTNDVISFMAMGY